MSEQLVDACLFLNNEPGYLLMSLLAFFFCERKFLVWALSLLLFTTVYNLCLKNYWQVPLPPALHKDGFAFPSGHMHSAVVFYGMLAWGYSHRLRWLPVLLPFLWCGIGISLVQRGYHYPPDIFAALGFGIISVGITCGLGKLRQFSHQLWAMPLLHLSLAGMLYAPFLQHERHQSFLLYSMATLLLLTVICFCARRPQKHLPTGS